MTPTHDTPLSGPALAQRAECIDTDSGIDQWLAAPAPVVQVLKPAAARHGELRMVRSVVPFGHFDRGLTRGCPAPADDAAFAAIEALRDGQSELAHRILVNDHTVPTDLAQRLRERGDMRPDRGTAWGPRRRRPGEGRPSRRVANP